MNFATSTGGIKASGRLIYFTQKCEHRVKTASLKQKGLNPSSCEAGQVISEEK